MHSMALTKPGLAPHKARPGPQQSRQNRHRLGPHEAGIGPPQSLTGLKKLGSRPEQGLTQVRTLRAGVVQGSSVLVIAPSKNMQMSP